MICPNIHRLNLYRELFIIRETEVRLTGKDKNCSRGWLHHKGRNLHHFEYWIDYSIDKDHPGLVGMKIPKKYMAEMFVDRVSAGKIYNGDKFDQKSPLEYFEHGIGASIMCEASRDYLLNLLRMYAEKGEKYTVCLT